VVASCESPPALGDADGSAARTGPDGAPDAEVGGCPAPTPTSPCRVDSDCQNPYLVCERPSGGVFICRDPQAIVDPACPPLVDATNVPACPTTEPVPYPVCTISYQRPCAVDMDCGPVGFICTNGRCQGTGLRPSAQRRLTARPRGIVTRPVRVTLPTERRYANRPSPCSVVRHARPRRDPARCYPRHPMGLIDSLTKLVDPAAARAR
jgi:hypothetical protein